TTLLLTYFFFFNLPSPPQISPLSLHDALPISISPVPPNELVALSDQDWEPLALAALRFEVNHGKARLPVRVADIALFPRTAKRRSEEHTSELQSLAYLVCRLLLEKKKKLDQKS